ncbi:MAG: peptide ABC transporter substrate-binding protein [Anaerolineales bacterium]|nr:peptide ABC transporter substrate-binding protein [Anaerolineales bacterium]
MKSGLLWSDGTPVTAEDSAYAFTLAKNEETPGSKFIFDRTQSYEAVDDQTLQWWGKPGFIDPTYFVNFWTPLPKHVWGQLSASELQKSELSSRAPMGYGPYVVKEWNDDSLRLTKNPYYFRAAEGLPKFDELIFRIVPNAEAAMANLINGRCDLIDSTVNLDAQTSLLKEMDRTGQARAYFGQTPTLEWLALGISPASYDDGVQAKDRPDFFADPRLRQAIAYCLDRQAIVSNVLYGLVDVPDSFAASASPLHAASLQAYPFDPEKGKQLLNNMGWRDHDNNPATPRHAQGVDRVVNGTELNLTYIATSAAQRRQVADILSQSLIGCGIGVNVVHLSQLEFYAEGPAGPLFGRNFDLAEFAMHTPSVLPACERFASFEIPSAANHWVGTNVSGYKNPEYDAACSSARQSLPSEASHAENYRLAQAIFVQDLPAIPLFFRIETAAARFDFCNFALDPTAASDLYNIEAFDYGDACLP